MTNQTTTIRLHPTTIERLRGFKAHPRATDDEALTWVLDKLEEADAEIIRLHKIIDKKKEA